MLRINVLRGMEKEFRKSLKNITKYFLGELKGSIAREILSKSNLRKKPKRWEK